MARYPIPIWRDTRCHTTATKEIGIVSAEIICIQNAASSSTPSLPCFPGGIQEFGPDRDKAGVKFQTKTLPIILRHHAPGRSTTAPQFARKMRADATKAENVLWQALRRKQLGGLKFKRQVPLDGYILDFVCFEAKLIVEVDGSQHAESARDQARDRHFEAAGFRVLRFWNDDVLTGLDGVCRVILREAQGRLGEG